ncbi:DUF4262 domain-containing protein [Glutamicibacter mishrai]|uniref:DUF4262 domain-containing protein n=2 Tax=Glutamicibacter mishrai TaxID=1775880 RepID=UPI001559AE6C|nr:DUF4262 domain-containing protein [Glutamicibacter mishrai]
MEIYKGSNAMCDICDGMSIEEADARTDQCIRDYGRQVLFVEPDRFSQPYAYTIGLTLVGHPELLVRGLDYQDSLQMLNGLSGAVLEHNEVYVHGQTCRWDANTILYFSKISSRISHEAPWAYSRYRESMGLLEVLFLGRDLPYSCLSRRIN